MKFTSKFDSTNNIYIIHVTGTYRRPVNSDELKEFAIRCFNEHGYRLFLIDLTDAEVAGGTMETFYAASPKNEPAQPLRALKAAFVRNELTKDDHFFETVAVNRGYYLRAFDSCDKAIGWLKHGNT